MLLTHDAAQVAGVGVGVEGDAPGAGAGRDAGGVAASEDLLIKGLDGGDVGVHVRDVAGGIVDVSARAEAGGQRRIVDEALHLDGEPAGIPVRVEEAVDLVVDVLGHAAGVGGDDWDAGLLGLVDDEG